jgi:tripartite-type tricarboxylate transporter receptor subunit TctC
MFNRQGKIMKGLIWSNIFLPMIFLFFNPSWSMGEKYPQRNIEMIISFPPGGPVDLMTRILGKYVEKELGVHVIPINKPGGGGSLAAGILASSPPDGYSLSVMVPSSIIMPVLRKEVNFLIEDFKAIGQVANPQVGFFVTHQDSPWKNFKEFVEFAKKNPGIKCGIPPITTIVALNFMFINKYADLKLIGVPFKTESEILVAILGKHVPIATLGSITIRGPIEAGKLRALFGFNPISDVIKSIKLDPPPPDFESFFGKRPPFNFGFYLWCNSKTPKEIVEILNKTLEKIVNSPEYDNDLRKIGYSACYVDGDVFMQRELPNITNLVKESLKEMSLIK